MDSLDLAGEAPRILERAPVLVRVIVRNYKSIEKVDVSLASLTVLVGRNGSGKSNFLDALRFIADSLRTSLNHALMSRGGFPEIKRLGDSPGFYIQLELLLPGGERATYSVEIGLTRLDDMSLALVEVRSEILRIESASGQLTAHYAVANGEVVGSSLSDMPPVLSDRLYLVRVSGFPEFRSCYDALSSIGIYDLNPVLMKSFQPHNAESLLLGNGSNLASVVARMKAEQPEILHRIVEYLSAIVPGIVRIERVSTGPLEILQFALQVEGSPHLYWFLSSGMSDGSLRVLGSLVAVNQLIDGHKPLSLVGIEEPEASLHPAAVEAMMEAFREASLRTQIILTSHSPDLLDQVDVERDRLLAVVFSRGRTLIAQIDEPSREAIRNHLYTPGELLRLDQLEPSREELERQAETEPLSHEDED